MNALLILSPYKGDIRLIREAFVHLLGFGEAEEWRVIPAGKPAELAGVIADQDSRILCCVDVTGENGLELAQQTRRRFAAALLVLVGNRTLSPLAFIRPSVTPSGLLFRPLDREETSRLLGELLRAALRGNGKRAFDGRILSVSSRGTLYRVPLEEILYFEARSKKIYLYTSGYSLEFYDTLERLMGRLPSDFIRCHKSFVVNRLAAEQVSLPRNVVVMAGGRVEVPISRSCRAAVREAFP